MDPQTVERAIKRCIDISVRLGALEDEVPPRGRPRHRPVRGRNRRNAAVARRPRVNTPAAGSDAAPGPAAELIRMRASRTPASDRQEPKRRRHRNDARALNPQRPVHVRPRHRHRRLVRLGNRFVRDVRSGGANRPSGRRPEPCFGDACV